ncbi:MAG: pyridoxal phosphate-dependent aminotransferase [Candidatus Bathyarchaeia archaeon]
MEAAGKLGIDPRGVLDFSSNTNPLGPSPNALSSIKENIGRIALYPESDPVQLKNALAAQVDGLKSDNVVVGNGSIDLIYLFSRLACREGFEAVFPTPTFSEYERSARQLGSKVTYVSLREPFMFTADDILDRLTDLTRIVYVCDPNNPTSTTVGKQELLRIVQETNRKGIYVLVDEDCLDFVEDGSSKSLASVVETYDNLVVLKSFTKTFGLPGLRIGYGFACTNLASALRKLQPPWCVNSLAQIAASAALGDLDHVQRARELVNAERPRLARALREIGAVTSPCANFILFRGNGSNWRSSVVHDRMLQKRILVRDCSTFRGLDNRYIRVSVRSRNENDVLLENLAQVKNGLG